MHGGGSGGPFGSQNGAWRHGRYTREAKEVRKYFRELAKGADELTATVMHAVGLKPLRAIRRRRHVKKAIAAAAKAKGEKA